jgi:NADH-quinone oxidoreductase subunit A
MTQLPAFVPLMILGSAATSFAILNLVLSYLLGKPRNNPEKSSTYECGIPSVSAPRERFPIKFYLVCMLFILFDVDAAFLYPWALVFKSLGLWGLIEMGVFVSLLGGGFVYAWKVGALDWQ